MLERIVIALFVGLSFCPLSGLTEVNIVIPAIAQEPTTARPLPPEEYVNTYSRPGRATHTIYVWGAVSQPGIWRVEKGAGLVEFLSVVRPSGFGVETPGTNQKVVLRIRRTEGGESRIVHNLTVEELLDIAPGDRPSLQAGDVLEVRSVSRRGITFQTVSTVVGTVSSLVLLGFRLADAF
jgi:hypothetical protein